MLVRLNSHEAVGDPGGVYRVGGVEESLDMTLGPTDRLFAQRGSATSNP